MTDLLGRVLNLESVSIFPVPYFSIFVIVFLSKRFVYVCLFKEGFPFLNPASVDWDKNLLCSAPFAPFLIFIWLAAGLYS